MSDGVAGALALEEQIDDVRAVVDAAGSERPVLLGIAEGWADEPALRGLLPGARERPDP